jgi:hypothetical protein
VLVDVLLCVIVNLSDEFVINVHAVVDRILKSLDQETDESSFIIDSGGTGSASLLKMNCLAVLFWLPIRRFRVSSEGLRILLSLRNCSAFADKALVCSWRQASSKRKALRPFNSDSPNLQRHRSFLIRS